MTKPLTTILVLTALVCAGHAQKVKKQTIKAIEGLQFNPVRISMKKNEKLQLSFKNEDPNDQPHNLVIIKPGSLKAIQDASMQIGPDSIEKDYVPEHPAVLAASKLLGPDKSETLSFTPDKKGVYHFICTFPGHAQVMYGAIYVDQRPPGDITTDQNLPELFRAQELAKLMKTLEVERPSVVRAFLPDAGPAAIAVALPDKLNFCWDAGNCRLRYAWTGTFVDARDMLNSNGSRFTKVMGDKFWSGGGDENTFTIEIESSKAKPDFKGYRLINGIPEFQYTLGGLEVRERITSSEGSLHWNLQIKGASTPVRIYAPGEVTTSNGKRDGDFITFDQKSAENITLKITPSK